MQIIIEVNNNTFFRYWHRVYIDKTVVAKFLNEQDAIHYARDLCHKNPGAELRHRIR